MTSISATSSAAPSAGDPLGRLSDLGVSLWLDDLSRDLLNSGGLREHISNDHIVGVTTNPTIFAAALSRGEAYRDQVRELARQGTSVEQAVTEIMVLDVQRACDAFDEVYRATNGVDGRVSLEVPPALAHDTEGTLEAARSLWKAVDRPNVMIKIPATEEGLPAITQALAEGISVNVTLLFSIDRYRSVMQAFVSGVERADHNGVSLDHIHSVASFFVSRVDTEIDKQLESIGTEQALSLRGQAALANARLAHHAWQEVFSTPRWEVLAHDGAHSQRLLLASTGTKNPLYSDTLYVTDLVTDGIVNTVPTATLRAVADHGVVGQDTILGTEADAEKVLNALNEVGINYSQVCATLEAEGVKKFEDSWNELCSTVSHELARFAGTTSDEEADQ